MAHRERTRRWATRTPPRRHHRPAQSTWHAGPLTYEHGDRWGAQSSRKTRCKREGTSGNTLGMRFASLGRHHARRWEKPRTRLEHVLSVGHDSLVRRRKRGPGCSCLAQEGCGHGKSSSPLAERTPAHGTLTWRSRVETRRVVGGNHSCGARMWGRHLGVLWGDVI